VCDQGCGADAKRLCEREHDDRKVAGETHAGNRFLAEPADEIQIHQQVQRLKRRRQRDERRELQQMAGHRPLGQIFHGRRRS
jgi:hypothetical protein